MPRGENNRTRQRGTTLTEAAFVSLPFFMLIFGIMEMGFLFRNYLTTGNTAAEASRAASVYGSDEDADFQILRSAEHGVAAMGLDKLERLIVFRAGGADAVVPAACLSSGSQSRSTPTQENTDKDTHPAYDGTAECNVYVRGDFGLTLIDDPDGDGEGPDTNYFGCLGGYSVDRAWCPLVRDDAISGEGVTGDNTDYVGIYVEVNHRFLTGFFQNSTTLTSTKIVAIEPERN